MLVAAGALAAVAFAAEPPDAPATRPPESPPPAVAASGGAPTDSGDRAPELTERVVPVHPRELRQRGVAGHVVIVCSVDEHGAVTETVVESASRPEFGEAAVAAVRQWRFSPGLRAGQPCAYRVKVPIEFNLPDAEELAKIAGRKVFVEVMDPIVAAEALPRWPMPRNSVLPNYPSSLDGSGVSGKVVVAFLVDPQGRVINPEIVKSAHDGFIFPAVATALMLQFDPIRNAKGQPIYVSMQVQYDFKDESAPARGGSKAAPQKNSGK